MNEIIRIGGLNLAIFIIYTAILRYVYGKDYIIVYAFAIVCHLMLSVILGAVLRGARGRAFFLSALVILLIGFSWCMGSFGK